MAELLDALILLNAPVPATALRNLAPDFENAVSVILARMSVENSAPLSSEFYRSPVKADSTLQYVSAALLASHPPSGFAATLLAAIKVRAKVFVVLPGQGVGSGSSSGACAYAESPQRDGWPEIGQYKLSSQDTDGASVLVPGTDAIYVTRVESSHYDGTGCGKGVYLGSEGRRRLIAEMLGVGPDEILWQTYADRNIEFESPEQFDAELLAFIEQQQAMFRETAQQLQARGLMTYAEVLESIPLLELILDDERGEGAEPITTDAIKLPPRVEWSSFRF